MWYTTRNVRCTFSESENHLRAKTYLFTVKRSELPTLMQNVRFVEITKYKMYRILYTKSHFRLLFFGIHSVFPKMYVFQNVRFLFQNCLQKKQRDAKQLLSESFFVKKKRFRSPQAIFFDNHLSKTDFPYGNDHLGSCQR